jgi:OFA family oxalate/formate antiporter-like MFS transporter
LITRGEEFRRGWRVLVASSLGIAFGASPLPFHTIGPLTVPLSQQFGWGRGNVQLALFLYNLAVVIVVPLVGGLADRIGSRKMALPALAAFGAMFASISLTPASLPAFYLLWFMTGALGAFSTPVSWSRGVNSWFVLSRGLALAIALTGTGIAAIFLPSLTTWLISQVGWRLTFVALALLPLGVALPVAIAWFREKETPGKVSRAGSRAAATDGAALAVAVRDYRFWCLAASSVLVAVGMAGAISNFVPLLVDRGFERPAAASIAGAIGFSIIVGRIGTGFLVDRLWAPGVAFRSLPHIEQRAGLARLCGGSCRDDRSCDRR